MTWTWDDAKVVAHDFETSGTLPEYALQPWRKGVGDFWATSMSVIRHNGAKLEPHGSRLFPQAEHMRTFLEQAIAEDWTVVGWNIVFDISVLCAYGLADLCHQVKWLDGMLLWRHLEVEPEYEFQGAAHKKKSYRLKPGGVERWLPMMAGYNEDVDFHATDEESLAKLQLYNDKDSVCTWIIAKQIWHSLTPQQQACALIEAQSLSMIAETNYLGLPIDGIACSELAARLARTADEKLAILAPHGVTETIIRSPLKLAALLFDDWGLPVLKENTSKKTGKVSRSTDKEVLHELALQDGRCRDLRAYRECLNNRTKFAEGPAVSAAYCGDSRSHPAAIPFGTYSGRLTYGSKQGKAGTKSERPTGFALHQEKRDKEFRRVVTAPPGYTLMEFDASGQEFRWMAIASGDETMLELCLPGEDPHSFMGARVTMQEYHELTNKVQEGDPLAKDARQLGKVANLSLQYRTSARKLRVVARVQYDIPMELPEAQRIHRTYANTYRGVPVYWGRQIALTRRMGYVETLAGRRVQVVGNWDGEWGWSMGSTAINYRIQGTGADQKYLAMAVIKPYLTRIGAKFAWDLHDGVYLWVPDAKVQQAAVDIKFLLDNLPYRQAWGITPPIPLPWDCKAASTWGDLKEWHYT